jgi:glycosyltransferase involved in cell wall biosynthesis
MDEVYLSTVTPVYRGAPFLRDLVRELDAARASFEKQGLPLRLVEAIFVDDGSTDDSFAVLTGLQAEYPWVRVIQLSRNFGQHPATVAGILHSCGDWVATLDEDLQHPPQYLLALLGEAVTHGRDVVYASPKAGPHASPFRNLTSRLYKSAIARLTGNPRVRLFNSFRMVRGSVARAAAAVSTRKTYLDIALCWFTNRFGTVPLRLYDPRGAGPQRSGYTFRSLVRHAQRMLLSSEIKWLRAGAVIGALTLLCSGVLAVAMFLLKIESPGTIPVPGWTSLFLAILFYGGLIALLVGTALEYLATVVQSVLGQPAFFVIDRSKDEILRPFFHKGQT